MGNRLGLGIKKINGEYKDKTGLSSVSSKVFEEMIPENNDVTLSDKFRSFVRRIKLGLK